VKVRISKLNGKKLIKVRVNITKLFYMGRKIRGHIFSHV
jgi:hypothetical protein